MAEIPANYEAALTRMVEDIQIIRDNFDTDPYFVVAGLADLEIAALSLSAHFIEQNEDSDVPVPTVTEVMNYMNARYVAAGVDMSHWTASDG